MIEIDILLGSESVSPWREEMICVSGALVLIVAKSVLANHRILLAIMTWTIDVQLQLDEDGENS
jgi:hypothetical protein